MKAIVPLMNSSDHAQSWAKAVARCQKRLNRGVLLDAASIIMPGWFLGACGAMLCFLLLFQRPEWRIFAWVFVGAGLIMLLLRTRNRFFHHKNAAAWLDRQNALHGLGVLIQDGVALPFPLATELNKKLSRDGLQWRWKRVLQPMFLPMASLLILQFIPWPQDKAVERGNQAIIQQHLSQQLERLGTLEQEKLLPDADLAEMKKEIEEINRLVEEHGGDPTLLENMDRMAEQIAKAEARALSDLNASLQSATSLQQLTSAGQAMEAWQKSEMKSRFSELLQKMKEFGGLSEKDLAGLGNQELSEMLRMYLAGNGGELPTDPKALEAMAEALQQLLKMKADKAGQCKLGVGPDGSYLTETEEERQALKAACLAGKIANGQPGTGGVDRGRADADLAFGDERRLDDKTFHARQLPEGVSPSPDNSITISVQALDPKASPLADPLAASKAPEGIAQVEGRGSSVPLRHRETVRHYFNSEKRSEKD